MFKKTFTSKDFENKNFIKELEPTSKQGKSRIQTTRWGLFKCLWCGKEFKSNLNQAHKIQVKYCCKQCVMAATRTTVTGGNEKHPLYSRWLSMKQRCQNPHSINWKNYGNRGISIEPYFLKFENYVAYLESLPGYNINTLESLQLDRINNSKGYERGNLRWTSRSVNISNTRKRSDAKHSKYKGITYSVIHKRWVARVHAHGKVLMSQTFLTEEEAVKARDAFIIKNNLSHTLNLKERATTISKESTTKRLEVPDT